MGSWIMKNKANAEPTKSAASAVPRAMRIQLAHLFGSASREAMAQTRTAAQWRHTLKSVLRELDHYIISNVDTDEQHMLMLLSGLYAADVSLNEEDFWPGYVEGVTRVALTLLGDYP